MRFSIPREQWVNMQFSDYGVIITSCMFGLPPRWPWRGRTTGMHIIDDNLLFVYPSDMIRWKVTCWIINIYKPMRSVGCVWHARKMINRGNGGDIQWWNSPEYQQENSLLCRMKVWSSSCILPHDRMNIRTHTFQCMHVAYWQNK